MRVVIQATTSGVSVWKRRCMEKNRRNIPLVASQYPQEVALVRPYMLLTLIRMQHQMKIFVFAGTKDLCKEY